MSHSSGRHRQAGMTYIGMLIIFLVVAFFGIVLVKVGPLYLENFKVKSVLQSLQDDEESMGLSARELKKRILRRFDIDDIDSVDGKAITIDQQRGKTVVTVDYSAQVPLFWNIDVVVHFPGNQVELTRR
ncbi:MAG TPA: DUF4845 domain-containing protein [Gammaproteobacteria bacterium]|nr:DUF4845 domain-containing protein [Gammaproteobacteria bacterium]